MLEEIVDFVKENCNKRAVIIFDTDGDGISAAAILSKTFKKLFNKTPEAIPASQDPLYITKEMFREIKRKKFEFVITVDMPVDEEPYYILKLAKKAKVLIIDHHQIRRNLNKTKNIIHINPILGKIKMPPFKYCASKIVYDACNSLTNIGDLDWLAGIGIVNDRSEDFWKDFLNKIYKKYPVLKNKFKLLNVFITSGYFYSGASGSKIGYNACIEASSPIDILKMKTPSSKKLKKFYSAVEGEIVLATKNWKKNAEVIENKKLIILKLNTKFSVNSPVSTKISLEKPNYTVLVFSRKGKMINISLRRQDKKVDCGKLAYLSTKNLKNANGGGHLPAAGAHITAKDWEKFRDNILNSI